MQKFTLLFLFISIPMWLQAQLFPQLGGQRAGISALTFLKIDVNPRSAAVGGANICLTGDAYSAFTNPAAVAETPSFNVGASHTFWGAGVNYSTVSASQPTKIGHFGLSVGALSSGAMEKRTEFQPDGTGQYFYASYVQAGLTFSQQLTEMFSYGIRANYVREQLAEFNAQTVLFDLGFMYRTDFKDLSFSVLIQNFGFNSTLNGIFELEKQFNHDVRNLDSYPAPTLFKIGVSMIPWRNKKGDQSLTILGQLNHPNDNSENIRLGVEYNYKSLLFFRAGYKINVKDQNLPTAGLGLRMRVGRHPLIFDYAADPFSQLGLVHRFGLQFQINPDQ